ncbi:hypothetical protein WN944_019002 [Citrus x changshan-huyou]|uniref:Cytochrome c assembly protein domain-containing protein n=1 Tax=Citrus x changshan-huyou TaxID=2935761 RepID=A0AAP0M0U0_9ROSI
MWRKRLKNCGKFYPCLLLVAFITLSSSIFMLLGKMELFPFFLSKAFIVAGSRTISSLLIKMGFSGGLALAVAWSLKLFISESCNISCNMMAPSGASGSGSGEGAGGRGFRWIDLFGSSSTGNSETSVNQPDPTSPNPGEPAAPIAEVYHPLLEGRQRRQELNDRLGINSLGHSLSDEVRESILETQFLMELKIEKALCSDRFSEDSLMYKRHQIRGILFYPNAMAIHLSLRVAPLDFQQGGNSHILYVHVPAARMSILVYIATTINTFLFLLTKHPFFLRSSGTGIEMGDFFTLFTLVTGGFRGRPMWGTFWVWDARLTSVFISFLIYLGALCFQKLPIEPASISIRAGLIDIPIIKSSVNWWNTSHQPGSISRSGTSIHVPMLIPILSNFANSPFSTRIFFVLETRLPIPSFLESPLTEEIEAREGIPKPSSLAESLCIHG